jgi:hypothetical protein
MGVRPQPGSPGRLGGGPPEEPELSGWAAIAQFGVGEPDPDTGIYPCYDIPEGHAAKATGKGFEWSYQEITEHWQLIEADFLSEYGIRLHRERRSMPWREFDMCVNGLMAADSRIFRRLAALKHVGGDDDER